MRQFLPLWDRLRKIPVPAQMAILVGIPIAISSLGMLIGPGPLMTAVGGVIAAFILIIGAVLLVMALAGLLGWVWAGPAWRPRAPAVRLAVRVAHAALALWVLGCVGYFVLGAVLALLPSPLALGVPVPWNMRTDFVETPDGRVLVSSAFFGRVNWYDRSGALVSALPLPHALSSAYLAAGDDNVVYLLGTSLNGPAGDEQRTLYAFDPAWILISHQLEPQEKDAPRQEKTWELDLKTGRPQVSPKPRSEPRPDRPLRRGDVLFTQPVDRGEFHCADGSTLRRQGNAIRRLSPAGQVLATYAAPWLVRLCTLPWPGGLALAAACAWCLLTTSGSGGGRMPVPASGAGAPEIPGDSPAGGRPVEILRLLRHHYSRIIMVLLAALCFLFMTALLMGSAAAANPTLAALQYLGMILFLGGGVALVAGAVLAGLLLLGRRAFAGPGGDPGAPVLWLAGRLARAAVLLWLVATLGYLLLGMVLMFFPFPVAWAGPVPWHMQTDFVETPDGRVLVCLRMYSEVRCYDRSGEFVCAYPFPKTSGSAYLAVGEDNTVYLCGIDYVGLRTLFSFDPQGNLILQENDSTPPARAWELSARTGKPHLAPARQDQARVDQAARPGDLIFSRRDLTNERTEFRCADGGTLRRQGATLERRNAAGDLLVTYAPHWAARLCALPWPGCLALVAAFVTFAPLARLAGRLPGPAGEAPGPSSATAAARPSPRSPVPARSQLPAAPPDRGPRRARRLEGLTAGLLLVLVFSWVLLMIDFVPQWQANRDYVEGRCMLLDKRVERRFEHRAGVSYGPQVLVRYTVKGKEYKTWTLGAVDSSTSIQALAFASDLDRFTIGQEYPCWYDPADPSRVMVSRDYNRFSYACFLAVAVALAGLGIGYVLRRRGARRIVR